MEHRKNNEQIGTDAEINCKWKAARNGAPNVAKDEGEAFWCGRSPQNSIINFTNELLTKAVTFLLIPRGRIFKLVFRSLPKNNAERHCPRRARTSAFI